MLNMVLKRLKTPLFLRAWLALAAAVMLIISIGQFSNLDLIIEDYYFDAALGTFPWDKSWFADRLMHGYVKNVIIRVGYLILLIVALDSLRPWRKISPFVRARLRFVALASVLVPTTIRTIKQFSVLHCPQGIDRYGGDAPFLRLLDQVPEALKAGHCFPAGHATVGLWLAAFCVFWLPHKPRIAALVFLSGLSVGLILGWVQQMRGMHFLFHTLWAAWLASLVILLMLLAFAHKLFEEEKPI
jgi:membrane-associated PAP2 superfamily phosphatase